MQGESSQSLLARLRDFSEKIIMEYEQQIRALDEPSKKVSVVARELSAKLGLSVYICQKFLYAKRQGYDSERAHRDSLAVAQGFSSNNELKNFRRMQKIRGSNYALEQYRAVARPRGDLSIELAKYLRNYSVPLNSLRNKLSENEQLAKDMDDLHLAPADSARSISKKRGLMFSTCLRYVSTSRNKINCWIYADFVAIQEGFASTTEKGHYYAERLKNSKLCLEEFRRIETKKRGFDSIEDYLRFMEDKRLFFPKEKFARGSNKNGLQKKFEYSAIEFVHPEQLDAMPSVKSPPCSDLESKEELWKFVKEALDPQQYDIVYSVFAEERTPAELAKAYGVTAARIGQIKKIAIRKLRHPSRLRVLEEFFD